MRLTLPLCLLLTAGCATVPKPDLESLTPVAEQFHERIRWRDFRGAAELIIPERRLTYLRARMAGRDEQDLTITDVDLEDARVDPVAKTAEILSRVSWYRLPSAVETTAIVKSVFAWREGRWLLESQDGGPFQDLAP